MIFGEKYFSCYILLTEETVLSGSLYFVRYWALCVLYLFFTKCDAINSEINRIFQIKPFFRRDQKVNTKV